MTALPYTVGIEIEFNRLAREVSEVVPSYKEQSWSFAHDGSCGYEVRSGIMSNLEDITSGIAEVCTMLHQDRAVIDDRCGLHVHIGLQNVKDLSAKYRLFRLCCHFEDVFFKMAAPSRRDNRFCMRISSDMRTAMSTGKGWEAWPTRAHRYHWLNGQNMQAQDQSKTTVEFRLMASTINAGYISGWIATLLCLVDTACNDHVKVSWENDEHATWSDFARVIHVTHDVRLYELAEMARAWHAMKPNSILSHAWNDNQLATVA